jgi:hypothetical protein
MVDGRRLLVDERNSEWKFAYWNLGMLIRLLLQG